MKTNHNPKLERGLDPMSENEADSVYGACIDDDAFGSTLTRYLHDDTMTRMDLVLEIESRAEALLETYRREQCEPAPGSEAYEEGA